MEALSAVRASIPLVLIEGSGRVCDKICELRRRLESSGDPRFKAASRWQGLSPNTRSRGLRRQSILAQDLQMLQFQCPGSSASADEILDAEEDEDLAEIASAAELYLFSLASGSPAELKLLLCDIIARGATTAGQD